METPNNNTENPNNNSSQADNKSTTVVVNQINSNGLGVAGLVLAIIGLFLCWIPILNWILWILGAALSVAGLFKNPKGAAIAGTVISFIDIIILIIVIASLASLMHL
ncbi:MAG: hypothetical protein LBT91_00385 [Bifidobacteriaceae bacterium]|jgi:hypothetical protein|nr:hypothetical protein [Bifidobacteriaceae bacterium]